MKKFLKMVALLSALSLVSCANSDKKESSEKIKFQKVYVGDGAYTIGAVFIAENGDSYCMGQGRKTFPRPQETKIKDVYYSESNTDPFMFILREDGTLESYGNSCSRGELGKNIGDDYVMKDVVCADTGYIHAGALTQDGSLYMWGGNANEFYYAYGMVGNGTKDDVNTPCKILSDVAQFDIHDYSSAAVTKSGELYIWGEAYDAGYDGGVDLLSPKKILDNIKEVKLGEEVNFALANDGTLYQWRSGNGEEPYNVTNAGYEGTIIKLGADSALSDNGTLYCYDISNGQLGKKLENVNEWKRGDDTWFAITTDGTLYSWGENKNGNLGTGMGYTEETDEPQKVLENIVSADVCEECAGAVDKDGNLYMWGYNSGQFGDGTRDESYKLPVKIEPKYS